VRVAKKQSISIGMPVYNGEAHLVQAIESLLGQSFTDFELIIADNASTDRTGEIAALLAAKDSRIRYYRHETNIGAVANFDFALKQATGEYFMWAAYDDIWDSRWLEKMVRGFEIQGVVLSFGKVVAVNEAGSTIRDCGAYVFSKNRLQRLIKYFWMEEYSGKACLIYGLFKTSLLLQCKPFAEFKASNFSDMLFVFNCLNRGSVYIDPSVVFYKRSPPVVDYEAHSVMARIRNSVFITGQMNYYWGYVEESSHPLDKLAILLLLPVKYAKALIMKIFRKIS